MLAAMHAVSQGNGESCEGKFDFGVFNLFFISPLSYQDVVQADPGGQDSLLHTAVCQYKSLIGVTQAASEELYISIVMQLEGYGNETFSTKVGTNPTVRILLATPTGVKTIRFPACRTVATTR